MDNKIFSAFQLTLLTISTLVYYIIKIVSINFFAAIILTVIYFPQIINNAIKKVDGDECPG